MRENIEIIDEEIKVEGGSWAEFTPESQERTETRGIYSKSTLNPYPLGGEQEVREEYKVGIDGSVSRNVQSFWTRPDGELIETTMLEGRLIENIRGQAAITSDAQISEDTDSGGKSRPVLIYKETSLRPKAPTKPGK